MSRNAMEDYMQVTGFLPRIVRDSAVCWRGKQLYIGGNPCYDGAPKYLTAAETREYMHKRFGYNPGAMQLKDFDRSITPETAKMQLDKLTISVGGRFIYAEGTPIKNKPGGITEEVVFKPAPFTGAVTGEEAISVKGYVLGKKTLPETEDAGIGTVGKNKPGLKLGLGGIGFLVIFAIGYLILRGWKK